MLSHFLFLPFIIFVIPLKAQFEELISDPAFSNYDLPLKVIHSMGQRLSSLMDISPGDNFVFSPLGATTIIAQLMLGDGGEDTESFYSLAYEKFHHQLAMLMYTLEAEHKDKKYVLNQTNAFIMNKNFKLKDEFKSYLIWFYGTLVLQTDFTNDTTRLVLNNWISESTKGIIKSIMYKPLTPSTTSILLNSVYFQAEWDQKFSGVLNKIDKFNTDGNTTVQVTYMRGPLKGIPYGTTKDYTLICLPYLEKKAGLYILLPRSNNQYKYNIKQFSLSVNISELLKIASNLQPKDLLIRIPKVSLSERLNIFGPLRKYYQGSKTEMKVLNQEKDILLSKAIENGDLKIDDIAHQVVFSVRENGTETASIPVPSTSIQGAKTLKLNRPFSFFVRDESTSATIFWGTVSNPTHG